jgi:hypothetical protein
VLIILSHLFCSSKQEEVKQNHSFEIAFDHLKDTTNSQQSTPNTAYDSVGLEAYSVRLWNGSLDNKKLNELWALLDSIAHYDTAVNIDENSIYQLTNITVNDTPICETESYDVSETKQFSVFLSNSVLEALKNRGSTQFFPMLRLIQSMYGEQMQFSEYVKNLLYAQMYLKEYSGFLKMITEHRNQIRADGGSFSDPSFSERLNMLDERISAFANNYFSALTFWVDRAVDNTTIQMNAILETVVREKFAYLIDSVENERIELNRSETQQPQIPQAIFFNLRTFSDCSYPPAASSFDGRKRLIRSYFKEADSALVHDTVVITGYELLNRLINTGSRFFDKRLDYFALSGDSINGYTWKKCMLDPKLIMYGCAWDDGLNNLGIQIVPTNSDENSNIVLYAGIPIDDVKNRMIPTGGYVAKLIRKTIQSPQSGKFINTVTRVWNVPPEDSHLKEICSRTGYYYVWGDPNYAAPNDIEVSGQDNEGIVHKGDSLSYIVQQISTLFAVMQSGDTTQLCTDTATGGYGDGVLCLHAARFEKPVFTDINNDGRNDLFIQTSTGTILLEQKENGIFNLYRF